MKSRLDKYGHFFLLITGGVLLLSLPFLMMLTSDSQPHKSLAIKVAEAEAEGKITREAKEVAEETETERRTRLGREILDEQRRNKKRLKWLEKWREQQLIDINAPSFPDHTWKGTLAIWHKEVGDQVSRDELIVEIETEKVVVEVMAPENGVMLEIFAQKGDVVRSSELLACIGVYPKTSDAQLKIANKLNEKRKQSTLRREREKDASKEEERQRKNILKQKEITLAKTTTLLTLRESVDVAKSVIFDVDKKSLNDYFDFLEGSNETRNLLTSFNEEMRSSYEIQVRSRIAKKISKPKEIMDAHVDADVNKCMELGLNNLMKTYGENVASLPNSEIKSGILKTHSWDDLKDKF